MNSTAITTLLAVVQLMLPKLTDSAAVQKIIDLLVAWTPIVVQFFKDQIPVVQNILAILASDPNATAEQIAECRALSAACDAAFDTALAAARAADAAAAGAS